jgi:hypothetical protein
MAFTKITAAGIGSTETVTLDGVSVINNESIGGNLTVTGNATIGGVLTYEDVTNVDSVGLITARNGVVVGSGITLSKDGDIFATGVTTSTTFVGALTGNVTGAATQVTVADESSDTSCNVLYTTSATGNLAPKSGTNLTFNSSDGTLTATKFAGDGSALTGLQAGKFLSDGIGITTVTPVGIETTSIARKDLAGPAGNTATGAGSSFHGAYMGDGFLSFNTEFSNSSGYYISTFTNALVAGPMQLGTTLTIDGNFTIV